MILRSIARFALVAIALGTKAPVPDPAQFNATTVLHMIHVPKAGGQVMHGALCALTQAWRDEAKLAVYPYCHGDARSEMASHAYRGGWGCLERLHCEWASSAACLASGCSAAPARARVYFIATLREPASRLASEYFWFAAQAFLDPSRKWKIAHGLGSVASPPREVVRRMVSDCRERMRGQSDTVYHLDGLSQWYPRQFVAACGGVDEWLAEPANAARNRMAKMLAAPADLPLGFEGALDKRYANGWLKNAALRARVAADVSRWLEHAATTPSLPAAARATCDPESRLLKDHKGKLCANMDAVRISEHWLERYRDDGDAALRDATTAVDASWGNHKAFDAARRALAAVTGALEEHVDNDARLLEGAKAQLDSAWAVIDVTSAATIDASWQRLARALPGLPLNGARPSEDALAHGLEAARSTMRAMQESNDAHSSPRYIKDGWPSRAAVVFWGLNDTARAPAAVAARARALRDLQSLDVALYEHALARIAEGRWG